MVAITKVHNLTITPIYFADTSCKQLLEKPNMAGLHILPPVPNTKQRCRRTGEETGASVVLSHKRHSGKLSML